MRWVGSLACTTVWFRPTKAPGSSSEHARGSKSFKGMTPYQMDSFE